VCSADNLLLRQGTTEIVLADFGTAQKIPNDHAPPNRAPTGSPAHWAPEKATSEGHGFPSDLWAAACVLIHMLSGSPPWISRFANAALLHFVVSES
jgi:serine/threonine protein kinase